MYRGLLRTARQCAISLHQTCVLPTDCHNGAVLRLGHGIGVQSLSTSSISYCEKKDSAPPHPQPNKEDANKDIESPTAQGTAETAAVCEGTKLQHSSEIGKGSLLNLLAAMKVEVTNKKRTKDTKGLASLKPTMTPKPAAMESTHSMFQKATVEASIQSGGLSAELVAAASAAAAALPDPSRAESELLKQLRKHEAVPEDHKKGEANNLGTIIADMKVGRPATRPVRTSNQIHFDEDGRGYRKSLFDRKRLGIFSAPTDQDSIDVTLAGPNLWDTEFANQLVRSTDQIPRNGFEQSIQWTREGKLWQYPIDNEAGMEEEAAVAFHEHIFLDQHLEEGFPRQGPVRHFMELVVAGLSRNPHLSVCQKREHIDWFRDYFQEKEDVLKEAGALHN